MKFVLLLTNKLHIPLLKVSYSYRLWLISLVDLQVSGDSAQWNDKPEDKPQFHETWMLIFDERKVIHTDVNSDFFKYFQSCVIIAFCYSCALNEK